MQQRPPPPCLTIIQPWVWAIEHAGKRCENRSWPTNRRGPLLLHAGMKYDHDGEAFVKRLCRREGIDFPDNAPLTLLRGGVLLRVLLVGCFRAGDKTYHDARDLPTIDRPVPADQRPWIFGPWCHLYDRIELVDPVAVRGMPGYFNPPDLVIRKRKA